MRYFIQTFGCQMNFSDSERIVSVLEKDNFFLAKKIELADLVIFNTCGIRQSSEYRAFGFIHNLRKKNPDALVVLTGCLAKRKDVLQKMKQKVDFFIPIKDIPQLPELIKSQTSSNSLQASQKSKTVDSKNSSEENNKAIKNSKFENSPEVENWKLKNYSKKNIEESQELIKYLSVYPKYSHPASAFVPIMTGCNNFCTYCVVPYARGQEISRSPQAILEELSRLADNSYQEITLLGQNVNSYSYPLTKNQWTDLNLRNNRKLKNGNLKSKKNQFSITFPLLLDLIAQSFPQITLRFISSHPKDFSEELIQVVAGNQNISREIHLPIQSGSNRILKAMNRPYTQQHYLNLIKKCQSAIPGVEFTTDVIVGFPGETEKDFLETKKIFELVNYNEAYINKYSPRPTAPAYTLGDPVPLETKKKRERILRKLVKI